MTDIRSLHETLAKLPQEWADDLQPAIQESVNSSRKKVVVLDDDPTGTQTVYDIPVLTSWNVPVLVSELANEAARAFYILTNSRSLTSGDAEKLNREIAGNLLAASRQTGIEIDVISRSDSTLRGHFPLEINVLSEVFGTDHACLLIPFFAEGGRYTIDDIHYVAEGDRLIPAAATPFAQDKVFGYRASNLREWVEEKTARRITAAEVYSISIEDIRQSGPDHVAEQLSRLPSQSVCVINAAGIRDLDVVVAGILRSELAGRRYIYRTAASFVQARLGLTSHPLREARDILTDRRGSGLIIVGSYVPKTTAQLQALLATCQLTVIEIDVHSLLAGDASVLEHAAMRMNTELEAGHDVVVYTSRELITSEDSTANVAIGAVVSQSLIRLVRALKCHPQYILAKGGITSSDIATKGLLVQRAMVLGQILPGVPVWRLGSESRFPGLPYIVFPGNVGDVHALAQVVVKLA